MIGWISALLTGNGFVAALCVGALAVFYTYDSSRVETGRQEQREETEKANRKASKVANRVRTKSKSRSVRGKLDPNTID